MSEKPKGSNLLAQAQGLGGYNRAQRRAGLHDGTTIKDHATAPPPTAAAEPIAAPTEAPVITVRDQKPDQPAAILPVDLPDHNFKRPPSPIKKAKRARDLILQVLKESPRYRTEFLEAAEREGIDYATMKDAITRMKRTGAIANNGKKMALWHLPGDTRAAPVRPDAAINPRFGFFSDGSLAIDCAECKGTLHKTDLRALRDFLNLVYKD